MRPFFMTVIAWHALSISGQAAVAAESLSLEQALNEAIAANPEIGAAKATASAEQAAISAQYSPDNPKIGFMRERDLNFMEQRMGPMNSWSVSQEFKFPVKYFLMGSAQTSRAEASRESLEEKKLEVRARLIATYYGYFSADRIIELLGAQRETIREIARVAEARYSTGTVPQQDQMKAHMEQAKVENDLLIAKEERESIRASLDALLNRDASDEIILPPPDIPVPILNADAETTLPNVVMTSKRIKASDHLVRESQTLKTLAGWNYAPDITLSYRKAYTAAPTDAHAFSVELSFPLWFFMRQSGEHSTAAFRAVEAEKTRETTLRTTTAEARALLARARSSASLIRIYETSLIPLATSTLNSSRGAYRAGKTSFIELVDSERALYGTRIAYYRTLTQYVEALVKLEQTLGVSVSSLPSGERT